MGAGDSELSIRKERTGVVQCKARPALLQMTPKFCRQRVSVSPVMMSRQKPLTSLLLEDDKAKKVSANGSLRVFRVSPKVFFFLP